MSSIDRFTPECVLRLNKSHVVYSLLDSVFACGIDSLVKNSMGENSTNEYFLEFTDIDSSGELIWEKPVNWLETDNSVNRPSPDVLELRTFLLSLLIIPTKSIASDFNFTSIPPLRPIPAKQSAVFRCSLDAYKKSQGWRSIAEQVSMKLIDENYPVNQLLVDDPSYSGLDEINRILSHPLFLGTDYEVTGECLFLSPISVLKDASKSHGEIRELLRSLEIEVHLKLRHKSNDSLVEIEDVGVGISQIIPVLDAIVNGGCVFIQQPELHLHPKIQAQLADAFVECTNSGAWSRFIIESHSEHFLLRLLRRIRETSKSDIKNKLFGLSAADVCVLYVDKLEDGSSKIFPLRISPDGEFIDRWPNGFFTERDGELFDE